MQCENGFFWSNTNPTDPMTQRCQPCSNNCKNCVDNEFKCTECYTDADLNDFQNFPAKTSYLQEHIFGVDTPPFILNTTTNQCDIQCRKEFWLDKVDQSDLTTYRCLSYNIKSIRYENNQILPVCWDIVDFKDYSTWISNVIYSKLSVAFLKEWEQFERDPQYSYGLNGICKMKCQTDYWLDWGN